MGWYELLVCGLTQGRAVRFPAGLHGWPTVRGSAGAAWLDGYVRSVEREDGSGRSFNVGVRHMVTGADVTVHVRTG